MHDDARFNEPAELTKNFCALASNQPLLRYKKYCNLIGWKPCSGTQVLQWDIFIKFLKFAECYKVIVDL